MLTKALIDKPSQHTFFSQYTVVLKTDPYCYRRMIEPEPKMNLIIDNPEKLLKLTVESRNGFYDYYMGDVNWNDLTKEEFHFLIPSEWIINGQELKPDTITRLLNFIKQWQFRLLGRDTRFRYEIIDFKQSIVSVEEWKKRGQKIIFLAKTNGEILQQIEMPN